MSYTVRIRNNATGEIRTDVCTFADWDDNQLFWWTDGNAGCDCNRKIFFEHAAGNEASDDDLPCGDTAYTAIDATLPDGSVIEIDGERR